MKQTLINRSIIVLLMAVALHLNVAAQKQPQVQDKPVRAPKNVKIDGRMAEWANPFLVKEVNDGYLAAYNSSSRVFYTVSNDDENLYLVARGFGSGVAQKMMQGGFVLTISHYTDSKRKKATDNVTIDYPIPMDKKITAPIMGTLASVGAYVDDDSVRNRRQIDSIQRIANKQIMDVTKEIRVSGIKEITDSVISVYNEQHIKAAMGFVKRQPIIELAIPLKYLGLTIADAAKFSYNIKVFGLPDSGAPPPPPPMMRGGGITPDIVIVGVGNPFLYSTTDFWGEYTLVKGN